MRIYVNQKELELLIDLEQRLVDDSKPFVQREEDRVLIGNLIDKILGGNKK